MSYYENIMDFARKQLQKLLDVDDNKISIPPNSEMGDYSTTLAFEQSKKTGENPTLTAVKIISKLDLSKTIFKNVRAYGPYINFFIDKNKLSTKVLSEIFKLKNNYGSKAKNKQVFITEFPSPNTNKPLHLGHLLQMILGTSISRILENRGYNVKRTNLYNDRGIHICKSMVAYEHWGKGKKPNKKPDYFVGDYYVMFDKKKNEKLENEVKECLKKWEEGDKKTLALWKKMNSWCYKGHNETYKRVGLDKYDKVYYESEHYKQGKKIVEDGLKKGVFEKDNNGSVFVELGSLGKKYIIRGDDTSLYVTQDLALVNLKYKDFKFDKCLYLTGNEQNHYFNQLFKIFELLDYKFAGNCFHIGTGMVRLPSGKMKSREGTVVDTDDLLNEMSKLASKEIKEKGGKPSNTLSESIGLTSVKYYFMKTSAHKDIVFNPEESISFEGNTGPYLLYSLVRAFKILDKTNENIIGYKADFLDDVNSFNLVKKLADFEEAIIKVEESFSPHHLCSYAYDLAKEFNVFYENCPVLKSENKQVLKARLALVKAFTIVMEKTLYLLGIEPVKKM